MHASGVQDAVLLLLCISQLGVSQGVGVCLSASLQTKLSYQKDAAFPKQQQRSGCGGYKK